MLSTNSVLLIALASIVAGLFLLIGNKRTSYFKKDPDVKNLRGLTFGIIALLLGLALLAYSLLK